MLSIKRTGKGNPLVLIHGFCENNTCFNEQVLLLKDHCEVITVNLPGIGESPFIPELSMEKCADALHHTLENAGLNKVTMIGHSMGGYITLAFAKKYPTYLSGFGLIHSTANADSDERKLKRDQAVQFIADNGTLKYVSSFIPPLFKNEVDHKSRIEELISEACKPEGKAIQSQLMAMRNRPSSREWLSETNLPGLFIAGKYDALIPVTDMIAQVSEMEYSSVHVLNNSAHMGMMEEPELMSKYILSFLSVVNKQ